MITATPIADWSWLLGAPQGDVVRAGAEAALDVVGVLRGHGLVCGELDVTLMGREVHSRVTSLEARTIVPVAASREEMAAALAEAVARERVTGGVEIAGVWVVAPGAWSADGRECGGRRIFRILVSMTPEDGGVTLSTYCDAWMAYDLRGRPQPDVFALNAPRLAAALAEVSQVLGDEISPDDPTDFGKPTETGVENYFERDGTASDMWGSIEALFRLCEVYAELPSDLERYEKATDLPVRYVPVRSEVEVLGFVWACDADAAAGYEPRSAAGETAFDAAREWLLRLGAAKADGLTPSQALERLTSAPHTGVAGRLFVEAAETAPSLDALQDYSGRC